MLRHNIAIIANIPIIGNGYFMGNTVLIPRE